MPYLQDNDKMAQQQQQQCKMTIMPHDNGNNANLVPAQVSLQKIPPFFLLTLNLGATLLNMTWQSQPTYYMPYIQDCSDDNAMQSWQ